MRSRDGQPTAVGNATAHCARIAKGLHILRLAEKPRPRYRHRIKAPPTSRTYPAG
ncbi:hypothetical protein OG978_02245 [Streptomyces sp. NBC_01591]|uniref:hypothetical protein n=1 Tax=Streptomyces sp. NBC_01591 TaxID=2975888 RepID=UPI002DDB9E4C|nr:hypothetical protein [Streptomyces sp. NBC_01591]WSD66334.1 hypothetical protein OG978_02245 [Streptomyces sp. NBC_01591]